MTMAEEETEGKEVEAFKEAYSQGLEMAIHIAGEWEEVVDTTVFLVDDIDPDTGEKKGMVEDPHSESRKRTPFNLLPLDPSTIIESPTITESLSDDQRREIQQGVIYQIFKLDPKTTKPLNEMEEELGPAGREPREKIRIATYSTPNAGIYLKEITFLRDNNKEWTLTNNPNSSLLDPSEQA